MSVTKVHRQLLAAALLVSSVCSCSKNTTTPPDESGDAGTVDESSPYRVTDLGAGRCVDLNSRGEILGVDENNLSFVIAADGTRRSLGTRGEGTSTLGLATDDGKVFGYSDSATGRVPVQHDGAAWSELTSFGTKGAVVQVGPGNILVGHRTDQNGMRSVVMKDGAGQTFPLPDRVHAANEASATHVVGLVLTEGGQTHGYVASKDAFEDLGTLGGKNSNALAINANGDVVGAAETSTSGAHAFVRYAGQTTLTDLGLPAGASSSDARGVDDEHRVAFNVVYTSGASAPFVRLRTGETFAIIPKDTTGAPFVGARVAAVAADGRIVGWGSPRIATDKASTVRCILWTPRS